MNLAPPIQALGRYEILSELGRGAMGAVYRARDPKIDRIVAIKTIATTNLSEGDGDEYRARFYQEARAAGRLSHPGIVAIYDIAEDTSTRTPYIVMECVPGQTLESLITSSTSGWPLARKLSLIRQVAEALDYAHREQVIHRDIKPANILVTDNARAKITDFGVARLKMSQMTVAGQIMGTPAYMSPEQLSGNEVDGRSDLFSLGVILYLMVTGTRPFPGDSLTQIAFQVAYKDPISASQLNPALSPDFNPVLSRALAKRPAERYQTGEEFSAELQDLQQGQKPRTAAGRENGNAACEKTVVQTASEATSSLDPNAPAIASIEALFPILHLVISAFRRLLDRARELSRDPSWRNALLNRMRESWRALAVAVRRMTPRRRAVLAGVLGMICVLAADWMTRPTLHIRGQHPFIAAELSVSADDHVIYETKLKGSERTHFLFSKTVRGGFSDTERISPGTHLIAVRVDAPDEYYDETKEVPVTLSRRTDSTLVIGFTRTKDLYVEWRNPASAPSVAPSLRDQQSSATSPAAITNSPAANANSPTTEGKPLLVTVFGSVISALMGWLIPEIVAKVRSRRSSTSPSGVAAES